MKAKYIPTLQDVIWQQLKEEGMIVKYGRFSDASGSWLEVWKTLEIENYKRKMFTLSFNYEGTRITNVCVYEEQFFCETEKIL